MNVIDLISLVVVMTVLMALLAAVGLPVLVAIALGAFVGALVTLPILARFRTR